MFKRFFLIATLFCSFSTIAQEHTAIASLLNPPLDKLFEELEESPALLEYNQTLLKISKHQLKDEHFEKIESLIVAGGGYYLILSQPFYMLIFKRQEKISEQAARILKTYFVNSTNQLSVWGSAHLYVSHNKYVSPEVEKNVLEYLTEDLESLRHSSGLIQSLKYGGQFSAEFNDKIIELAIKQDPDFGYSPSLLDTLKPESLTEGQILKIIQNFPEEGEQSFLSYFTSILSNTSDKFSDKVWMALKESLDSGKIRFQHAVWMTQKANTIPSFYVDALLKVLNGNGHQDWGIVDLIFKAIIKSGVIIPSQYKVLLSEKLLYQVQIPEFWQLLLKNESHRPEITKIIIKMLMNGNAIYADRFAPFLNELLSQEQETALFKTLKETKDTRVQQALIKAFTFGSKYHNDELFTLLLSFLDTEDSSIFWYSAEALKTFDPARSNEVMVILWERAAYDPAKYLRVVNSNSFSSQQYDVLLAIGEAGINDDDVRRSIGSSDSDNITPAQKNKYLELIFTNWTGHKNPADLNIAQSLSYKKWRFNQEMQKLLIIKSMGAHQLAQCSIFKALVTNGDDNEFNEEIHQFLKDDMGYNRKCSFGHLEYSAILWLSKHQSNPSSKRLAYMILPILVEDLPYSREYFELDRAPVRIEPFKLLRENSFMAKTLNPLMEELMELAPSMRYEARKILRNSGY